MFGLRLKELREQRGYSMDKLIELYNQRYNAKMNKSTLSRYENGLQDPIYTVVVNLADFFSVSLDYLTGMDTDIEKISLTQDERKLINNFKNLNELGKGRLIDYSDELTGNIKFTKAARPFKPIPNIGSYKLIAYGGNNESYDDEEDDKPQII